MRWTESLLQNYGKGRSAVLVIDEAQHLSADLLVELRLLGNLEGHQGKALKVILVGQPSLLEVLGRAGSCRVLSAPGRAAPPRAAGRARGGGLHRPPRVRAAGGRPEEIFTEEALQILARGTQGVPRLLNQAGHQALAVAQAAYTPMVDAEVALEALTMLGLNVESEANQGGIISSLNGQGDEVVGEEEVHGPVLTPNERKTRRLCPGRNRPRGPPAPLCRRGDQPEINQGFEAEGNRPWEGSSRP